MTRIPPRFSVGLLTALLSATAFAHPGHGQDQLDNSVWHFLLEPIHVSQIALLSLAAIMVWVVARRLIRTYPQTKRSHL
ncbi:MAG: hypothetical protein AAF497_27455 [Planctomycetota bacterium]